MFRFLQKLLITAVFFLTAGFSLQAFAVINDPTRPDGFRASTEKSSKTYKLNSVLIAKGRKVATINGRSYEEGDRTGLGVLKSIAADKVVIQGARKHTLMLGAGSLRR